MATTLPAAILISFWFSSNLTGGGWGDSITAQEKSLGKVPLGATRTRNIPSRKAVIRTFADPAASSTPSFNFSTRCTLPRCCQPCAAAVPHPRATATRSIPTRPINPAMNPPGTREAAEKRILHHSVVSSREPLIELHYKCCGDTTCGRIFFVLLHAPVFSGQSN